MASSVFSIAAVSGNDITVSPDVSSFEVGQEVLFNVNGVNQTTATFTVSSITGPDTITVVPAPTGVDTDSKVIDLPLHQRKRLLGLV